MGEASSSSARTDSTWKFMGGERRERKETRKRGEREREVRRETIGEKRADTIV